VFTLYTTPLSANGRKVLAVARELGLEPEIKLVNVYAGEGRSPEFRAVHPLGKIPALVEGDFTLWESNAILVYLSEVHGEHRLFSRDPRERADILRWLFWEASLWQPALSTLLAPCVGHRLLPAVVSAPGREPDWKSAALVPLLALLEDQLATRAFLLGAAPTLADFSVAGMTTYFRYAAFPFAEHPRIRAWCDRLNALASWRASADPLWGV
jgi:glutathione S-transferase